jgi:hypothetical protein
MQSPERQRAWFDRRIRPWLAASPATHKLLTWGNHDWCGQACRFDDDGPTRAASTDLQILVDEDTRVPSGTGTALTVWATPWSKWFGWWAFMKDPEELATIYAAIPAGVDILVSHQPPFGHGDLTVAGDRAGSRDLLAAIERVRPRLVICGHIHEGHGRTEHQGIPIYNVSVVDEHYRPVHAPTLIHLRD